MSRSELLSVALCLGLAPGGLFAAFTGGNMFGTGGNTSLYDQNQRQQSINAQRQRLARQDPEELRAAIDETQELFRSLAAETARQERAATDALLKELRQAHRLGFAEKPARRALELSEEIEAIQGGIRQQQQRLKDAAPGEQDREEARLLGLQSDLLSNVERLRRVLRGLHSDLKERELRELRNWAMVSEGLLRRRREEAEDAAARQRAAEGLPLDAGALSPDNVPPPPADKP